MPSPFKSGATASGTTIRVFIYNDSSSSVTFRVDLHNEPSNGVIATQEVTLGGYANTTVEFTNLAPGKYGVIVTNVTNGGSDTHAVTVATTADDAKSDDGDDDKRAL